MAKKQSRSSEKKEQRPDKRRRKLLHEGGVSERAETVPNTPTAAPAKPWYEKHEPIILALIIFVAFILRLGYLTEVKSDPDFAFPNMDAAYKDYWARSILAGGPITDSLQGDPQIDKMPYLRPPAYPFFLSFVYLLTGTSYTAVRVIQMAFGLASIFLLYRLGRKIFGSAVGLTAAAFMSVYWIFIYFEGELNAPSVIVFLLLGMMNMLYHWPEGITRFRLIIPAVCYGLLVLIRPETLLFSPVFAAWAWFALAPKADVKRRILTIVAFFAIVAGLIAPVTLRNIVVSGEPVLICTIGGLNFYAGHNEEATGNFPDLNYAKLFGVSMTLSHNNFPELLDAYQKKTGDETHDYSDLQNYFFAEGLRFIVAHPFQELKLLLTKTLYYWGPAEISSNKVLALEKRDSPVLRFLPGFAPAAALFFTGLLLLLRGSDRSLRDRFQNDRSFQMASLLVAFVFVSFATHLLFFVVARFRVPAIPFFLLFAAYAVCTLGAWWSDEEARPKLMRWAGIALGLLVLFSINFSRYQPEVDRWHFQRGSAYGVVGDIDQAVLELETAVEEGTTIPAIPSELGFAFAVRGDFESAERWYRKALEIDPNHADTLNKLGYALVQLGRHEEAVSVLDRGISVNYTNPGLYLNKADALAALGEMEQAEAALQKAEDIDPAQADASFRLAQSYVRNGDHAGAVAKLEEAIARAPEDARLHNFLGYELATIGEIDRAEEHYKKALAIDANFTLAHNNLGNLYTHKKDYDRAVTHYMEVSRINPYDPYVFYGWGIANDQRGETERAIQNFRLAVRNDPNHFNAYNYLGFLLAGQGKIDEAIENYKSAIVLNPRYAPAHLNLGNAYLKKNMNAEALEQFEAALNNNPGSPDAQAGIDRARAALGR